MQHIIQHLFRADTLEDVPRERLEALVEEYPSFGIARYLLSSKLRAEHAEHFEEETRKTNLYFTNPFWLQWLLQQTPAEAPVNGVEKEAEMPEVQTLPSIEEKWVAQPVEEFEVAPPVEPIFEPTAIEPPLEPLIEHAAVESWVEPTPVPMIGRPAEEPVIAPPVAEQPLVFESYHMIDYFASQGIKLAPDENPTDRLGKQMKSFTEWLKVMKRLPQKEAGAVPDPVAENKIQAIAANSNEGKEVVTETMAEVLAKQGMWEKATDVYRKLSLLNPDKSGYFAAKIEQLKTN